MASNIIIIIPPFKFQICPQSHFLHFSLFFSLDLSYTGLINNNCFYMQINIDQYIRNFRIFYQQLAKGHPNE